MRILAALLVAGLTATTPALAADAPVFAAECAGGVNQGGYNIDTDKKNHLWVNGHRTVLHQTGNMTWEGGYHGVTFSIGFSDTAQLEVFYTARKGDRPPTSGPP
jgi:hypothetical protein